MKKITKKQVGKLPINKAKVSNPVLKAILSFPVTIRTIFDLIDTQVDVFEYQYAL